jgi:DNA-binding LacI/PurR family transcriptional regulator
VARRAGVSQSTVSLVLSGKSAGRISARTEAAVRQAADELGYRPNVAARALRTGTARTVGLVVTDVTHPFFGPVLRGAQVAAWRAGYAVALVDVANDPDRELASFEALRAGPVDGFLFFTVDPPESTGEHVVALEVSPPGMSFVRFDTERGTELALRHLLELGHTRIGHLGSELDAETFRFRRDTLLRVLGEAGLEPGPYARAPFRFDKALGPALSILDAPERPTAVYCDDDLLAGGVYLAARERRLRIPADL